MRKTEIQMQQIVSVACDACGKPMRSTWTGEAEGYPCWICGGDYHEKCLRTLTVPTKKGTRMVPLCRAHFTQVMDFIQELKDEYVTRED